MIVEWAIEKILDECSFRKKVEFMRAWMVLKE